MHPYRVFISYSHQDRDKAELVRAHLARLGACPMADVDLLASTRFSEEIRRRISHAHVFVSILTGHSKA